MSQNSRQRRLRAKFAKVFLAACASVTVITLAGILGILAVNSFSAFTSHDTAMSPSQIVELKAIMTPEEFQKTVTEHTATAPPTIGQFIGGDEWRPDSDPPEYGLLSMIVSTLLVTAGAMAFSIPIGVGTAGWLSFRATGRKKEVIKFAIEMLSAIPSVVLGFIGIVIIGPIIGKFTGHGGLNAFNGALLLSVMALPTVISISEDAFSSVPAPILRGSLALGANGWQTFAKMAIPAAKSGIFAAILLGMGRAIGETMTVLMACGNVIAMPHGLFDPVRTMTATIAIELGEVPTGTTHYFMLFAVGLALFLITLLVNLGADWVRRRGVAVQ